MTDEEGYGAYLVLGLVISKPIDLLSGLDTGVVVALSQYLTVVHG